MIEWYFFDINNIDILSFTPSKHLSSIWMWCLHPLVDAMVVYMGPLHFHTYANELRFVIGWSYLDIKNTNLLSSPLRNLASLEQLNLMSPSSVSSCVATSRIEIKGHIWQGDGDGIRWRAAGGLWFRFIQREFEWEKRREKDDNRWYIIGIVSTNSYEA